MIPSRLSHFSRYTASLALMALPLFASVARADWQRDDTTISWKDGSAIVWRFNFDPKNGKTFFDPLGPVGGASLTNRQPRDHPWHYGLWFSWKYINETNYWEEDRTTGQAVGKTSWGSPVIDARPDGSATIHLDVTYTNQRGHVDMIESREIKVSAPAKDGGYLIDWHARFVVGTDGALLDRTPLLGEPKGQVNGGYAGMSIRMAGPPLVMTPLSTAGPLTEFKSSRARPNVPAVAFNFADADGKTAGAFAFMSDPANAGENAPWYLINDPSPARPFFFACEAILAPKPIQLAAGAQMELRYRFAISHDAWTPETLLAKQAEWIKPAMPPVPAQ
jgi:hypothetical protein